MLNIVVPMAGRGSRFQTAGYTLPKPLIPVHGQPMISLVIHNVRPRSPHRFIFICLQDHLREYSLERDLNQWAPGCVIVPLTQVTQGAACTVLEARSSINNEEGLMIVNSDQWVDFSVDDYLRAMEAGSCDGMIMTMKSRDPKWSYVKMDAKGTPLAVVEKQVVSDEATVGIYNFAQGSLFVQAAEAMIRADERVNGEFYVAPTYNAMIRESHRIGLYNVGTVGQGMYGLGTPADLEEFVRLPLSRRAVEF